MTDRKNSSATIRAKFLGNAEISVNEKLVADLSTIKTRGLFIYLIQEGQVSHNRSKLAAFFWPDSPEQTALHNLRQAMVVIKRAVETAGLDGELIQANRDEIRFLPSVTLDVDSVKFVSQVSRLLSCSDGFPERGFPIASLKHALDLFEGEFLKGFYIPDADLFEDWQAIQREAINQLAIRAYNRLMQYHTLRNEWNLALGMAEKLAVLAPWDEDVHKELITCLLMLSQKSAAQAHYRSTLKYFTEELGLPPGDSLSQAWHLIQNFDPRESAPNQAVHSIQLPKYAIPFVGRSQEIETLEAWISSPESSVLTITGPGGVGKTRLAIRLAEMQVSLFKDGVHYISIANCSDQDQIEARVFGAIHGLSQHGSSAFEQLADWACRRKALLVFDNVEDTRSAAVFAARLIEKAPKLVMVFTSYKNLGLIGEKVLALTGLPTQPGATRESIPEALQLYLSHLNSDPRPEQQDAGGFEIMLQICQLVDGIPLAIDLAAGQSRHMPVQQLLSELQQTMDVLRLEAANLPERHRSIQASFESIWRHLSPEQQGALSLLTGFETPFSIEGAQAVYGVDSKEISELMNVSLINWDGRQRYWFHRTIRHYAGIRLDLNPGEAEAYSNRHASWFLGRINSLFDKNEMEAFSSCLNAVEKELEDHILAAEWLIQTAKWKMAKEYLVGLYHYFEGRELYREGSSFFLRIADLCREDPEALECQVLCSARAAQLLVKIQQYELAEELGSFALETSKRLGWHTETAFCLNFFSTLSYSQRSSSEAEAWGMQALAWSREHQILHEEARALYNLGYTRVNKGDLNQAADDMALCLQLSKAASNWLHRLKVINVLADIACYRGELEQALSYFDQSLAISKSMGNLFSEALIANNIGTVYIELQDFDKANKFLNMSLDLCRKILDHEGEAVALSNLGEVALNEGKYDQCIQHCTLSLNISREVGSNWGEMSALIILAEAHRKTADLASAKMEVIEFLEKSIKTESNNFFYRGIVEAGYQLQVVNKVDGLADILVEAMRSDGMEDYTRKAASELLKTLPPFMGTPRPFTQLEILTYFRERLAA